MDALARLVPLLGRVAVVSGRPAGFLTEHVPVDGLVHVGLYGLERVVDGTRTVDPRAVEWIPAIGAVAAELERRLPDLLVERKGELAVTVHWRTSPDLAGEAVATVEAVSAAPRLGVAHAGPDGHGGATTGAGRQGHRHRGARGGDARGRVRG